MRMILHLITAAVIIHNLLIEYPPPEEWTRLAEEEEGYTPLGDDDELNHAMPWTMDAGA